MVDVHLLNKNNIINLSVPGKAPIRGRVAPNLYFHTPIEILLSALGLCIGGVIVNYCRLNSIDVALFESIKLDYDSGKYHLDIRYGKTLTEEHMKRIANEIADCPVSRELRAPVGQSWFESDVPVEELTNRQGDSPCCGG